MQNKRYQVFVSSTYTDLTEERQAVLMTLLTMDCLPAGMELFGAVDEEQFEFIKRVIDDSDYYVLIVGGRYGTLAPDGRSYTEKEYDYAVSTGKRVLAFLHGSPGKIAADRSEGEKLLRDKLDAFRSKINTGRIRTTWETPEDLAGKVATSLMRAIKLHPAVGWVRANTLATVEALTDLNQVRKENAELREQVNQASQAASTPEWSDLAGLDDAFQMHGLASSSLFLESTVAWESSATWREIFKALGPHLTGTVTDEDALRILSRRFAPPADGAARMNAGTLADSAFQPIKFQLIELKLVQLIPSPGAKKGPAVFWGLTPAGRQLVREMLVVRTGQGGVQLAGDPRLAGPSGAADSVATAEAHTANEE